MSLRCIAQSAPAATTATTILDGSQQQTIHLRSLVVCNRDATSATFRIWLKLRNEADANKQYLYYAIPIVPNDTFSLALDIGVQPGDVLKVYASTANLSFNLFGSYE